MSLDTLKRVYFYLLIFDSRDELRPLFQDSWPKGEGIFWETFNNSSHFCEAISRRGDVRNLFVLFDYDALGEAALIKLWTLSLHFRHSLKLFLLSHQKEIKNPFLKSSVQAIFPHPIHAHTLESLWKFVVPAKKLALFRFFSFFSDGPHSLLYCLKKAHRLIKRAFVSEGLFVIQHYSSLSHKPIAFFNKSLFKSSVSPELLEFFNRLLVQRKELFKDDGLIIHRVFERYYCLIDLGEGDGAYYAAFFSFPDELAPFAFSSWTASFSRLLYGIFQHTLRPRRENKLARLTHIDDVTGLYNQRRLYRDLQNLIECHWKNKEGFSLLFIDIDYFKKVNDQYGHLIGSLVLSELARLLKTLVRENDYLYRYGGDEFIIILPKIDMAMATRIAHRILETIKKRSFDESLHPSLKGHSFSLELSIGVAEFPQDAETLEKIVHCADSMMYEAKRLGRGQVRAAERTY